jgi:predicted TIM-barrel fold metal-dependent hydrolase
MQIIDSQIHLWTGGQSPAHHRQSPNRIEDALREMKDAGVDAAVNCPAIWDPASNDYAVEAASKHPDKFATLGWFDTTRSAADGFIDEFVKQPGMLGLRFILASPAHQTLLRDGELDWIWEAANRLELPVGLGTVPALNDEIARIAGQFPKMRLLIDHIGIGPFTKLPQAAEQLNGILALARFANVAVKASGTPSMATDSYPFNSVSPVLKQTFEAFGPRRMFWGTDITRMSCSWSECITAFTGHLDWLKGDDLEWVMGRGICEWIRWSR